MSGIGTIFRREIKSIVQSPIAAIVLIAFLLLTNGLFTSQFFLIKLLDLRIFFDLLPPILAVILPAVSMRSWAEDRQLNTLELLMSLPVRPLALVVGKYLASLAFFLLMLICTFTVPLTLRFLGSPDWGPVASGYLGVFLTGALFLAIGQFVSGFCKEQIVAFIIGLFACMGVFLLGTELIAATLDGWWPGFGGFLQQHLGLAQQIVGFQKGIVSVGDVTYFILLIAAFLVLNGIWMEGRLRPTARVLFAVACTLSMGIAVATHVVVQQLPLGRFDWTRNHTYTVSAATREILRGLEVPATVKLYLSPAEKMPTAMRTLERSLKDILEELCLSSGNKLTYTVSHLDASALLAEPEESAEGGNSAASKLGRKGIRPFQVQSIETDEVGVRLVYASAAIAYKDRPEELIPQIVPSMLDQMEYLVVSKIHRMTLDAPPAVAIVAPYEQKNVDPALMGLLAQLGMQTQEQTIDDEYKYLPAALRQEGYPIHRIRLTKEEPIPPQTKTLVVVQPRELNDRQRYEINRFLVEGGTVFIAAQRYRFQYEQRGRGIIPHPENQSVLVDPLLEKWGVAVDSDILLDTESRILSVSSGNMGPFSMSVPVQAPVHIMVNQSQMNSELFTGQLSPLLYLWGSALKIHPELLQQNGLTSTVLFTSSPKSWTVPKTEFDQYSTAPRGAGRLPLAVWVRGPFPDAYAGQNVPDWPEDAPAPEEPTPADGSEPSTPQKPPEKEKPTPVLSQLTSQPGQLILVGCSEMFKEQLAGSPGHISFFLGAVDTLASGGKLTGVRNKQGGVQTFTTPSAGSKAWMRFFNLGLIPILIVVFTVAYAGWRRRIRNLYASMQTNELA